MLIFQLYSTKQTRIIMSKVSYYSVIFSSSRARVYRFLALNMWYIDNEILDDISITNKFTLNAYMEKVNKLVE